MQIGSATTARRDLDILTEAARSALVGVGIDREGARLQDGVRATTAQELMFAGYVGNGRGLTRAGVIARMRLVERQMEEMFG